MTGDMARELFTKKMVEYLQENMSKLINKGQYFSIKHFLKSRDILNKAIVHNTDGTYY
jgi:hypothetical protein